MLTVFDIAIWELLWLDIYRSPYIKYRLSLDEKYLSCLVLTVAETLLCLFFRTPEQDSVLTLYICLHSQMDSRFFKPCNEPAVCKANQYLSLGYLKLFQGPNTKKDMKVIFLYAT